MNAHTPSQSATAKSQNRVFRRQTEINMYDILLITRGTYNNSKNSAKAGTKREHKCKLCNKQRLRYSLFYHQKLDSDS